MPFTQGAVIKAQPSDLHPGMTPAEVRQLLGTPVIQTATQWLYVFYRHGPAGITHRQHLQVVFRHGRVDHIAHQGITPVPHVSEP